MDIEKCQDATITITLPVAVGAVASSSSLLCPVLVTALARKDGMDYAPLEPMPETHCALKRAVALRQKYPGPWTRPNLY